ncbi:MAG: GGDEF domain-containing protein [Burkholderiaceae bacterium]
MKPNPLAPTGATADVLNDVALGVLVAALVRRNGDGLALKDARSGAYLHVDDSLLAWLECSADELIGRTDADIFGPAVALGLRSADQAALTQSGSLVSEHRFEWKGVRREFSVLRQPLTAGPDRALLAAVWRDTLPERRREAQRLAAIAQLEQQQGANEQLRREMQDQRLRDRETGLYNCAHFEDQLRREVDLSTREHREFALVSIELDERVSGAESHGEAARIRVYEALGRLLRGNTRAMDASCRQDDRRFAVLLSGVGLATAHSRMEGLRRQCVTQIVGHEGRDLGFTVSMGVASFPHTAHGLDELRAACDTALLEARERGGNHVTLASIRFDPP